MRNVIKERGLLLTTKELPQDVHCFKQIAEIEPVFTTIAKKLFKHYGTCMTDSGTQHSQGPVRLGNRSLSKIPLKSFSFFTCLHVCVCVCVSVSVHDY